VSVPVALVTGAARCIGAASRRRPAAVFGGTWRTFVNLRVVGGVQLPPRLDTAHSLMDAVMHGSILRNPACESSVVAVWVLEVCCHEISSVQRGQWALRTMQARGQLRGATSCPKPLDTAPCTPKAGSIEPWEVGR
jgi:hypothetical protein